MVNPLKGKKRGRPLTFRGIEYPTRMAFLKKFFGEHPASIPALARIIYGRLENDITEDVFLRMQRAVHKPGRSPDSYKGRGAPLSIRSENRHSELAKARSRYPSMVSYPPEIPEEYTGDAMREIGIDTDRYSE